MSNGAARVENSSRRAEFARPTGSKYRVHAPLGRGGMASVWSALDTTTQEWVALKRLTGHDSPAHVALFEREYHALAALKHPNIVEVYDYGIDTEGPYYAMELLEGSDLSAHAPMPWREVCRILRDVASALALLHARRLLHRDVGPRNVWRTTTNKIKLIDFGALAAFGNVSEVVGTPPCIAPEGLLGQNLDQRTDLYALGALGYWLLTGLHAHPARAVGELSECWDTPPKPVSARVRELDRSDLEDVPEGLDTLLNALLSLDRAGRPTSASEVIERVSAIAQLDVSDTGHEAGAYLSSTAFVGRSHERERFRAAMENAARGEGTFMLFEGPAGIGRTRLLTELANDARFMRGVVLQAEVQPNADLHGFALAIAHKLLDALPKEAREAAIPFASTLGHLSPGMRERLCGNHMPLDALPEAPGEARMRMQAALLDWMSSVRSERPIVMMVDDLQTVDSGSAGWLAALSRACTRTNLLIVAAFRDEPATPPGYVVQALRQNGIHLPLDPLTETDTLELVSSVFGETPNVRRLGALLFERASGNPVHTIELADHLVRQRVARYVAGTWVLPTDIAASLPENRHEVALAKLAGLSAEARSLAQVLTVHEGSFSLSQCRALSELDPNQLFSLLQTLVAEGVLMGAEGGHRFAHRELREMLARELAPDRRAQAHLVLGRSLLQRANPTTADRLRTGLHLMLGGEREQGSLLVSQAAVQFGTVEHADTGLMGRELQQALKLFREDGRTDAEQIALLCAVSQSGYYGERQLASKYGDDAMRALQGVLRLPLALRLRPYLGRKLSLIVAIFCAAAALGWARRKGRCVPSLQDTVRLLMGSACALAGISTICIDPEGAARYARIFEPLTALGKDHASTLMYDFCMNLSYTVRDQPEESIARWERFIQRLESQEPIRDLPGYARVFYLGGALYARGVVECWRESPHALEIADRLENITLRLYALSADQLRAFYHGIAGDLERYEFYRDRVEVHAIQRGTAWQVEIWAPAAMLSVHLRTRDAMRMKQCVEQLKHLYEELPSLSLYAVRGRGAYALLRGNLDEAVPLLEKVLEEEPLAVVGWTRQHGALAQAYNLLGRHQEAKETCLRALSFMRDADLEFTAMNLGVQVELGMAESGAGQHAEAAGRLDALIAQFSGRGLVTCGLLHDARLRIALAAGDELGAAFHFDAMKRFYLQAGLASLLERLEQLAHKVSPRVSTSDNDNIRQFAGPHRSTIVHKLEHGGDAARRDLPEWMLSELARHAHSDEGYLIQRSGDGAECVAQLGGSRGQELAPWVASRMHEYLQDDETAILTEVVANPENPNVTSLGERSYRLRFLLTGPDSLLGAIVLPVEASHPSEEALRVMAQRLAAGVWSSPVHP